MVTEIELFESPKLTVLDFCLCGWMNSEVYKTKLDTTDELLASILDDAGCMKKREDKLRQTTRDLHTRVANCGEVSGEVFRIFIVNCNKFVIYV